MPFRREKQPHRRARRLGHRPVQKEKPDVIIALGGGSAMDEAKFIGVGALYDGDPWDFPLGKAAIEKTIR